MQLCHTLSVCYLIVSLCVPYVMTKSVAALPLPLPPCVFVIHGTAICVVHWPIFRWRHCPPPFPSNNSYIVSVHLNRSYGRESRIYRVSSLFPEFRMNINIPTLCHICGHRYRSELHILIFVLRFGWIIEECGTNRISNCLLSLWKNDLYKSLRSPCVYERTNRMKSWNATTWHTYARAHATPAKKKDGGKKLQTEDRSTSRWEKCITNVQRNATTPFLLPLPPPPPPSLPRQESEWIHAS